MINLLRRCNTRVMAGCTIATHYSHIMGKSTRECNKTVVSVARRAVKICLYMTKRLANTDITVMAGSTIAGIYAHVVKRCSSKVGGVMANGAILVVGIGRYVIWQFTNTDRIVMARFTVINDTGMIIAAGGKGARAVANTTILNGRHVVGRFAAGINAMAGRTIVHEVRMINECTSETFSIMARSTIGNGSRVGGHRRCFSGRVNTIAIIVAQSAWLY